VSAGWGQGWPHVASVRKPRVGAALDKMPRVGLRFGKELNSYKFFCVFAMQPTDAWSQGTLCDCAGLQSRASSHCRSQLARAHRDSPCREADSYSRRLQTGVACRHRPLWGRQTDISAYLSLLDGPVLFAEPFMEGKSEIRMECLSGRLEIPFLPARSRIR